MAGTLNVSTMICWKILREDRTIPPISSEYLRTGGATTFGRANAVNSFISCSPIHWNMVVQHDVGEHVLADVNIALHSAEENHVVDSAGLHTNELWLEQDFWAAEMIVADEDVATWKLVSLHVVGTLCCGLQLGRGGRNVAQLVLGNRGKRGAATRSLVGRPQHKVQNITVTARKMRNAHERKHLEFSRCTPFWLKPFWLKERNQEEKVARCSFASVPGPLVNPLGQS